MEESTKWYSINELIAEYEGDSDPLVHEGYLQLEFDQPIKNWNSNLSQISKWFGGADVKWSDSGICYVLGLGSSWTVSVACSVNADLWDKYQDERSSIWLLDLVYDSGKELEDLDTPNSISLLLVMDGEVVTFSNCLDGLVAKYPSMGLELQTMGIGLELLWKEIFKENIIKYGLALGAWLSGVILDLRRR